MPPSPPLVAGPTAPPPLAESTPEEVTAVPPRTIEPDLPPWLSPPVEPPPLEVRAAVFETVPTSEISEIPADPLLSREQLRQPPTPPLPPLPALPTPPFPYSRWVRLPSVVAPYVAAGIVGGDMANVPWRATGRIDPVVGLRLDLWGPLFRIETGVSLRTGRVGLAVDVHPDWWALM